MKDQMGWILTVTSKDGAEKEYRIAPGSRMVIGRSRVCDLVLHDPAVSRKHCMLEVAADGALKLVDLGASRPVKLDGIPVATGLSFDVADGSRITIGSHVVIRANHEEILRPPVDDATCLVDLSEDRTMAFIAPDSAEVLAVENHGPIDDATRCLPPELLSDGSGTNMLDDVPSGTSLPDGSTQAMLPIDQPEDSTKTRYIDGFSPSPDASGGHAPLPDKTKYIDPEELKELVAGKKKTKNNSTRLVLMVLLLASCALLLIPKPGSTKVADSGQSGVTKKFTYGMPDGWKMSLSDDGIFSFTERGQLQVLVLARMNDEIRRWTYGTCMAQMLPKLLEHKEVSEAASHDWQLRRHNGSNALPNAVLDRAGSREIPFASFYTDNSKKALRGRIYLNDNTAICLLYLNDSDPMVRFLDDFRMAGATQFIDRRLFEHDFGQGELQGRLNSAESLLRNHGNSAENYWAAYKELLRLQSWIAVNHGDESIHRELWKHLKDTADWLAKDYFETYGRLMRSSSADERRRSIDIIRGDIPEWDWRYIDILDLL